MGNFTFNEPNYKECIIEWLDTKEREEVTISIGGINPTFDDYIFYNVLIVLLHVRLLLKD